MKYSLFKMSHTCVLENELRNVGFPSQLQGPTLISVWTLLLAAYCYIQMVLVGEQNVPLAIGSLSRPSRPAWAQTDTASHQISVCQIYGNGPQQPSRRWHQDLQLRTPQVPHSFLGVCHLPTHWPYADIGGYNPKKWPSKRQLSCEAEPPKVGQNNGCTGFDNPLWWGWSVCGACGAQLGGPVVGRDSRDYHSIVWGFLLFWIKGHRG